MASIDLSVPVWRQRCYDLSMLAAWRSSTGQKMLRSDTSPPKLFVWWGDPDPLLEEGKMMQERQAAGQLFSEVTQTPGGRAKVFQGNGFNAHTQKLL